MEIEPVLKLNTPMRLTHGMEEDGLSNRIEVPVASRGDIDPLGAVISGTKVPTRPTTGPVRADR